ncbi:hypothetical protein BH10BAC4_BH10BAC4_21810 [soil metagenome]
MTALSLTSRFKIRTKHHLVLSFATFFMLGTLYVSIPGNDPKYLWSMATGYTSIVLLAITLLVGPLNIYYKNLNPVTTDLRRDVGIWCALTGFAHVIVGIQVHMGNIWLYFFKAVEGENAFKFRDDFFGSSNYVGLVATFILLLLLLLSNDLSLKWLRTKRWKNLQRLSYLLFILVLMHGVMYQIIEKRKPGIIILFAIILLVPVIGQAVGFSISRKAKS